MVIVQVLWPQPGKTLEQARESAERSAPKFRGKPGLLRKYYLLGTDSGLGGGLYVWESRALAEAYYTPEWSKRMAADFGHTPEVRYFEVPLTIENSAATV